MQVYCKDDTLYPEKLKLIENPPEKLYVLGELPDRNKKTVAIVGARECSPYGKNMAFEYARILAMEGVQIVSGLARGVDSAAHRGALAAGEKTFAVMGCGADVCYPEENQNLYEKIIGQGGIISEFEEKEEPIAWHFPMRNRLISGLADLILVVEAREKSGSLITADRALEQGRDVYALPGRVGDALSWGCNRLIAQGAGIAWHPEELLVALFHRNFQQKEEVSSYNNKHNKIMPKNGLPDIKFQQKNISGLAREEKKVYSCISLQPMHINEIVKNTGLALEDVLPAIFSLELQNLVIETTMNYYAVNSVGNYKLK